jgi:hypothetical protein
MISIEKCKKILNEEMTDIEVRRLRDSLYTMAESILDNYFEEFANINLCKKPLSTVESQVLDKAQRDMDLIVKSIDVENMPTIGVTRS